jgi:hypothetical protein
MSDSMENNLHRQIEDYLEGKLMPADSRALAQEALDKPDLFDELTATALAKTALETDEAKLGLASVAVVEEPGAGLPAAHSPGRKDLRVGATDPIAKLLPFRRKGLVIAMAGSVAASLVIASFYFEKSSQQSESTRQGSTIRRPVGQTNGDATKHALQPALDPAAGAAQPILLASLQPRYSDRIPGSAFRGPADAGRLPKPQGSILALDEGVATVDLGALDGLAKGVELGIFRDGSASRQAGSLTVTTVFRTRARGRISTGAKIQTGDTVHAKPEVYLAALLAESDARASGGDLNTARDLARRALVWTEARDVQAGERRRVLVALSALEYRNGEVEAAQRHLESAVSTFDATPGAGTSERITTMNNLGSLYLLRGDYRSAESLISAASKIAARGVAHGEALNNLGVLAEITGRPQGAEDFYEGARQVFENDRNSSARDLHVVEKNLARLKQATKEER